MFHCMSCVLLPQPATRCYIHQRPSASLLRIGVQYPSTHPSPAATCRMGSNEAIHFRILISCGTQPILTLQQSARSHFGCTTESVICLRNPSNHIRGKAHPWPHSSCAAGKHLRWYIPAVWHYLLRQDVNTSKRPLGT